MDQQNEISLAPEKMGLSSDTLGNCSINQHSAIKSKILNSIDKIRKNKKCADLNAITDYIIKNRDVKLRSRLYWNNDFWTYWAKSNQKQRDSTRPWLFSVDPVYLTRTKGSPSKSCIWKMRLYFPQSIEIDSISNETIPKIETDLGITEIKEKRQTKIEKCKQWRNTNWLSRNLSYF